jgi:anti-sigma regulatory factor (Ser/Thr protein kinase)
METMRFEYQVCGGDFANAGAASSETKKILRQLNVDSKIIKRIVVSLYEAEVNIVAHAYEGTIELMIDMEKIMLRLTDKGPGIPDIQQAMEVGYSTASSKVREMGFGAGMGLPNIQKNADDLKIESEVDKGTVLEITVYLKQE